MKIKEFQLNKILEDQHKFLCFLIYGPNEGLVRTQVNKIIEYYSKNHEYDKISLNGKELDEDNFALEKHLKTISMFAKGKVLIANSIKDKHLNTIEHLLQSDPQNTVFIIQSESLSNNSKLRKFFENEKICFSLACYDDDTRSLMNQVDSFISKNKLHINREIKNFLIQCLSNDRMINEQELEKILVYINKTNKELTIDECFT